MTDKEKPLDVTNDVRAKPEDDGPEDEPGAHEVSSNMSTETILQIRAHFEQKQDVATSDTTSPEEAKKINDAADRIHAFEVSNEPRRRAPKDEASTGNAATQDAQKPATGNPTTQDAQKPFYVSAEYLRKEKPWWANQVSVNPKWEPEFRDLVKQVAKEEYEADPVAAAANPWHSFGPSSTNWPISKPATSTSNDATTVIRDAGDAKQ